MSSWRLYGRVVAASGHQVRARGLEVAVGQWCRVVNPKTGASCPVEVVAFDGEEFVLTPLGPLPVLDADCLVCTAAAPAFPEVDGLLGRVINGLCQPLDGGPVPAVGDAFTARTLNPLGRAPIRELFDVGVRSINALLSLGVGQRVGLFAGSGVGKSVLMGMISRFAEADRVVVGLIGERGREVQEFVAHNLGSARDRAVVIASPADDVPALRLRSAWLATELASAYREQGHRVLLLLDSLTRVAQAQREIGLAAGEPTTSKGYPPSVFRLLPQLVEQAGTSDKGDGSVSAIYTVLVEEDDLNDPVVDAARSILDGHLVLNRRYAEQGLYPAIDVSASISRLQTQLQDPGQRALCTRFKQLWSRYQEQADLLAMGAYEAGSDPVLDAAIKVHDGMREFLAQDDVVVTAPAAFEALRQLLDSVTLPSQAVATG